MKPYTFYLHEVCSGVPAFDFVRCDDDDDAIEHARSLLAQYAEYEHIEVFDGGETRFEVRRDPQFSLNRKEWAGF